MLMSHSRRKCWNSWKSTDPFRSRSSEQSSLSTCTSLILTWSWDITLSTSTCVMDLLSLRSDMIWKRLRNRTYWTGSLTSHSCMRSAHTGGTSVISEPMTSARSLAYIIPVPCLSSLLSSQKSFCLCFTICCTTKCSTCCSAGMLACGGGVPPSTCCATWARVGMAASSSPWALKTSTSFGHAGAMCSAGCGPSRESVSPSQTRTPPMLPRLPQ
mmetsp:Transcript_104923/g.296839  ORF Transcript_104923/g.296839 Transcript_104923/m.296839 type:complete len:214 (-) Transcript_104923:702-1343(-)